MHISGWPFVNLEMLSWWELSGTFESPSSAIGHVWRHL